ESQQQQSQEPAHHGEWEASENPRRIGISDAFTEKRAKKGDHRLQNQEQPFRVVDFADPASFVHLLRLVSDWFQPRPQFLQ
ncbi:MAG: hypothetical protein J6038_04370, partial [Bacilli bacterium]|nr:hypothetical protein [Bacilli bacterium]